MCQAGFDIHGFIKPSTATLRTYGGGEIRPVGLVQLVCETQGKFHTLQFQLLNKDVMGSQPSLLNGSDCVRLGLIEIGRRTCSLERNKPNGGASEVCQPDLGPHRGRVKESYNPGEEVRPASLKGSATEELNLTEETTSTSPINGTGEDISVVHSSVTREGQVNPTGSMANEVGVSHVPFPWGKLTKAHVMDAFKDVHTGLGTLGPPLHISMNPNVTPIQAHPHWCSVAKEAKASDAIRDPERQGILKKVTEPTAWISNSVYREKLDGNIRCALIPAKQSVNIKPYIEVPKYPLPTVDELLPKLNNAKKFSFVDVYKGFTNIELVDSSSFLTSLHTPIGRYRWLRMPFGVSLGPEEYQRRQHEPLEGLAGVVNKADDILVFGSGGSIEEVVLRRIMILTCGT